MRAELATGSFYKLFLNFGGHCCRIFKPEGKIIGCSNVGDLVQHIEGIAFSLFLDVPKASSLSENVYSTSKSVYESAEY